MSIVGEKEVIRFVLFSCIFFGVKMRSMIRLAIVAVFGAVIVFTRIEGVDVFFVKGSV